MSFARNIGKNICKNIIKSLSSKYSQKLIDLAKRSATDGLKTASKKAIQKPEEPTGDVIGYKIVVYWLSRATTKLQKSQEIHHLNAKV